MPCFGDVIHCGSTQYKPQRSPVSETQRLRSSSKAKYCSLAQYTTQAPSAVSEHSLRFPTRIRDRG